MNLTPHSLELAVEIHSVSMYLLTNTISGEQKTEILILVKSKLCKQYRSTSRKRAQTEKTNNKPFKPQPKNANLGGQDQPHDNKMNYSKQMGDGAAESQLKRQRAHDDTELSSESERKSENVADAGQP